MAKPSISIKKDRFYIYQARWRSDFPMAHLLPHWNWPERAGQITPVHVYTSGDEAELFLNGRSLGHRKKAPYEYRLRWDDVKYEPGELKVVAYKNGKRWAEDVMKTTGPASALLMKADHTTINADGQDVSFITVTVADKEGWLVPRSMNRVRFEISGPGEIVAVDNRSRILPGERTKRLQRPGFGGHARKAKPVGSNQSGGTVSRFDRVADSDPRPIDNALSCKTNDLTITSSSTLRPNHVCRK